LWVIESFNETIRDPALLDEVRKRAVDIDPLPGSDVPRSIQSTFDISRMCSTRRKLSPRNRRPG
jgi:hypothetical protein